MIIRFLLLSLAITLCVVLPIYYCVLLQWNKKDFYKGKYTLYDLPGTYLMDTHKIIFSIGTIVAIVTFILGKKMYMEDNFVAYSVIGLLNLVTYIRIFYDLTTGLNKRLVRILFYSIIEIVYLTCFLMIII